MQVSPKTMKALLFGVIDVPPFKGKEKLKMQFLKNFLESLYLAPLVWLLCFTFTGFLTDLQCELKLSDYQIKRYSETIRAFIWVIYSIFVAKQYMTAFYQYVKYEKQRKRDELAEEMGLINTVQGKAVSALPPELDTPRAREYFKKAQEAGFIAKTSTGYKWVTDNKSECSYFCDLCSDALKLSKSENRTSWKPFAALFGYKAEVLREAKNGWKNKTGLPARWKEIEAIFK